MTQVLAYMFINDDQPVGNTGIGCLVTSTPAKIEAVSEIPGNRSCNTSAGR